MWTSRCRGWCFEQQLLETVYGISRLYYDLVSLGENIGVKGRGAGCGAAAV